MLTDATYLKVVALIKSLQSDIFTTSRVAAAFVRSIGLTKYYKVYLQTAQKTYEAYVANDGLRNRTYLLTFTLVEWITISIYFIYYFMLGFWSLLTWIFIKYINKLLINLRNIIMSKRTSFLNNKRTIDLPSNLLSIKKE